MDAQLKALRLQKITAHLPSLLRNCDPVELQPAPWSHADLAQMERSVKALAEFLLNAIVRGLRLHIQINGEQNDAGQNQGTGEKPEQNPAEFFHRVKLRRA